MAPGAAVRAPLPCRSGEALGEAQAGARNADTADDDARIVHGR